MLSQVVADEGDAVEDVREAVRDADLGCEAVVGADEGVAVEAGPGEHVRRDARADALQEAAAVEPEEDGEGGLGGGGGDVEVELDLAGADGLVDHGLRGHGWHGDAVVGCAWSGGGKVYLNRSRERS